MAMLISKNSLTSLEFDLILERLSSYSFFEKRVFTSNPDDFFTDENELKNYLDLVRQLHTIYLAQSVTPIKFIDISSDLEQVVPKDSILEAKQIYNIALFLKALCDLKEYLDNTISCYFNDDFEIFSILKHFPDIPKDLSVQIFNTFDSNGDILLTHPDMVELYKERSLLHRQIDSVSSGFLSKSPTIYQESFAVVRNGRVLLPLKNSAKGQISGIIHDISATGNTIFIEPQQMVELNNKMQLLDNKAKQIHYKWVSHFSLLLHQQVELFFLLYNFAIWIDGISARARYAIAYDCVAATSSSSLNLPKLIHPLLAKNGVASCVELKPEYKLVVVSGANAGGKSVFLKSVALAVLMNQYGFFIHAKENPTLPVYNHVVAIVGDNQSISEGSSTFSGYMKLVASILKEQKGASFIVLDELGSATDPSEGGALAVAILEHLLTMNTTVFVSTHLQEIRSYANSNSMALNATVLFDEKSCSPTYQVCFGKMGLSKAIDVASRSGIPCDIIKRAHLLLEKNKGEELLLLDQISVAQQRLEEQQILIKEKEESLLKQKQDLAKQALMIKEKEYALKRDKQDIVAPFIVATKKQLKDFSNQLSSLKHDVKSYIQKSKQMNEIQISEGLLNSINDMANEVDTLLKDVDLYSKTDKKNLQMIGKEIIDSLGYCFSVGMKVMVGKYKKEGEIVKKEKSGYWSVQLDSMKISIHESELKPSTKQNMGKEKRVEFIAGTFSKKASYILDVRGQHLEEAIMLVDEQIDAALLNGLKQFSIIHGLGTGVLQQGIQAHLRKTPTVKEFFYAPIENGGYGKTEVILNL